MNRRVWAAGLLLAGLSACAVLPAIADEVDPRIEKLEREVAALRQALEQQKSGAIDDERLAELRRQIDILAAEVESLRIGQPVVTADESVHGFGPAASKVYRTEKGVSIGGYGEWLYQNLDSTLEDGTANGSEDSTDFLRAVLYVGYKFNDRFLFNSEIEFEHGSTEEEGAVSVEFGYIDYLWRESVGVRAGLLLVPMGFINELHEPIVFLGALRPATERRILPTTWREMGAGIFGDVGPFTYRTYIVSSFDAAGFAAQGLRDGRQNGSKAKANDFAWTGRFDYVGTPGLLVGASGFHGDTGQGLEDSLGTIAAATSIVEAHVDWRFRGLELRLLGTRAEVDDVARLNQALGLTGDRSIGESLVGGYAQVGFDVLGRRPGDSRLVPYVRWEALNTQDRVPAGFSANPATDTELLTLGVAYQPIRQLIVKAEYQDASNEANTGFEQYNVSLGYAF